MKIPGRPTKFGPPHRSIVYTVTPNKYTIFIVYYNSNNKVKVNSKLSCLEKSMLNMYVIVLLTRLQSGKFLPNEESS